MNSVALDKSLGDYDHVSEYTPEWNGRVIKCAYVHLQ